jgi:Protein of unknown function (DUF4230)
MISMRSSTARNRTGLTGFAVMTGLIVGLLVLGGIVGIALFRTPFKTVEVDRSAPPVLTTLRDLSLYKAAQGQYEVLVDVEKDVKYVPAAVAGERVLFVGVGTVDATIDFRALNESNVQVSDDRTSVVIVLPIATLDKAVVNPEMSRVASRKRGVFDRVAGVFSDNPTSEQGLYAAAADKMDAAAAESGLMSRAMQNTTAMLTALVKSLGFTQVTVRYEGVAPTGPVSETQVAASPSA